MKKHSDCHLTLHGCKHKLSQLVVEVFKAEGSMDDFKKLKSFLD